MWWSEKNRHGTRSLSENPLRILLRRIPKSSASRWLYEVYQRYETRWEGGANGFGSRIQRRTTIWSRTQRWSGILFRSCLADIHRPGPRWISKRLWPFTRRLGQANTSCRRYEWRATRFTHLTPIIPQLTELEAQTSLGKRRRGSDDDDDVESLLENALDWEMKDLRLILRSVWFFF